MAEITGRATGLLPRQGRLACTSPRCGTACSAPTPSCAARLAIATGAAYGLRLQGKDCRGRLLLRRRRLEPGHLPRGRQPRLGARRCRWCSSARTTGWAISTPFTAAVNVPDIASAPRATASRARRSTATTCVAVREVADRAVARARAGDGPDADRGQDVPHHAPLRGDAAWTTATPRCSTPWRERDPIKRFGGAARRRHGVDADGSPRSTRRRRRGRGRGRAARWSSRPRRRRPRSRTCTRRPAGHPGEAVVSA